MIGRKLCGKILSSLVFIENEECTFLGFSSRDDVLSGFSVGVKYTETLRSDTSLTAAEILFSFFHYFQTSV